jgi:hypothetical protein
MSAVALTCPALRPSGALEVRQVTVAFNRMRDRLQRQVTGRMEILRNVSHDLRNPPDPHAPYYCWPAVGTTNRMICARKSAR